MTKLQTSRKSLINTIEKIYSKDPSILSINGESLNRESMEEYKNMTPEEISNLNINNFLTSPDFLIDIYKNIWKKSNYLSNKD